VLPVPDAAGFATMDAGVVLIGGLGDAQPQIIRHLEALRVIGRTTADFPAPGGFLIQRRVNPHFPDRVLVVVTAADREGLEKAVAKLAAAGKGLQEARKRHATRRRALALVDDNAAVARAFTRYVLELPTRSLVSGRDDLRTTLSSDELLDERGHLRSRWVDLTALVVASSRPLTTEEAELVQSLARNGITIVWSAPAIAANPEVQKRLGVGLGDPIPLTGALPVKDWAQQPLRVPDMGSVITEPMAKFGKLKPDSAVWRGGTQLSALRMGPEWLVAAADDQGRAVAAQRADSGNRQWVFGADLQNAAVALWSTNRGGVIHGTYDRDTACGLERLFRVVANAVASGIAPRQPETRRLRAEVSTDRETYRPGAMIRATVEVRDELGEPQDAGVWVSFANPRRLMDLRGEGVLWTEATRTAKGRYEVLRKADPSAPGAAFETWRSALDGHECFTVLCDVVHPEMVSDWASQTVRMAGESAEDLHMADLAHLVERDLKRALLGINDKEKWVEVEGSVTMPAHPPINETVPFEVVVSKVEGDEGNDWMEDIQLVLTPASGSEPVVLPLWEGKYLASSKASVVTKEPDRCIVVDSSHPAALSLQWPQPRQGHWRLSLRYRYSDDYHIADTNRLQRDDPLSGAVFVIGP